MIRANNHEKYTPWFARAGAACSIVPVSRFVGSNAFALKGGGYGCLFSLTGIDEEGQTDEELEARVRSIEGALRGLPEGSCLYQYTHVIAGFDLPRQPAYNNPVTETFVNDRLSFLQRKNMGTDEPGNRNDAARRAGLREPRRVFLMLVCVDHSRTSA